MRLALQRDQAARDARDVQQVVDQAASCARTWRPMIWLVWRTRASSSLRHLQQLGGRADRRQRVAQFVRQHGQEFVLAAVGDLQLLLRFAALGDVAEEERDAAVERAVGADFASMSARPSGSGAGFR